jgi:hypothetical protein
MGDPDWQRVFIEDQEEALRPGAEGWADEAMAVLRLWDFDPSLVSCSLTWGTAHMTPTRPSPLYGVSLPRWME